MHFFRHSTITVSKCVSDRAHGGCFARKTGWWATDLSSEGIELEVVDLHCRRLPRGCREGWKVQNEIPATESGQLHQTALAGKTYAVGALLGRLDP